MATKNEFGEIQRKNLEAAMRLAQLSIDNSQKIMALQSQLARDLLVGSMSQAKDQVDKTDPLDVMNLRTRYTQDSMQKMLATAQEIADIGNNARAEFSRLLTEQLAAGSHDMVDAFQSFFKALPGQNAGVLETMQQAMANANAAFEQMSQASAKAFENMNPAATTRKK
jgi:phasin family protein